MTLPLMDVHKKILMSLKPKLGHTRVCTCTCAPTHVHALTHTHTEHRQSAYQEKKCQLRLKGKQ